MGPKRYAENLAGPSLRARRRKLGLTVRTVAADCGVSYGYVAQLERGEKKTLSPEVAFALLEALHIDSDQWAFYFRFHGLSQARFRHAA